MNETFRLGRIAGVAVGVNWSLLVIFWLISWSLAAAWFPEAHPGHAEASYWVAAVLTAFVFFGCLLAHEMGHAVVARRLGMRVDGITLWLFGGVARIGGEAATARAELHVALVGPAVSVVAAAAFGLGAFILNGLGAPELTVAVCAWLARINLILAVFNMVPAYPLDGGRVLRALLWGRHGDRLRATATAARSGRTFAYILIGLGLLGFATGGSGGGLWFVFLGWFLLMAARAEETGVVLRDLFSGLQASDIMSSEPVVAPDSLVVTDLLERYAMRHRFSAFPVINDTGQLTGLITLARLKRVPPSERRSARVREVACPLADVPIASPTDPVIDLLERMNASADGRALVLDNGRLVGIVSPTDVARMIELATLQRRTAVG